MKARSGPIGPAQGAMHRGPSRLVLLVSSISLALGACGGLGDDEVAATVPLREAGEGAGFSVEVGGWEGVAVADGGDGEVVIVDSASTDAAESRVYRRSRPGGWSTEVVEELALLDPAAWLFDGKTYVAAYPCADPVWDLIRGEELGPDSCGSDAPMTIGTIAEGGEWDPIMAVPGASLGTASVLPSNDGIAVVSVLTGSFDGTQQGYSFDARTHDLRDLGTTPPGPGGSEVLCVGDEVVSFADGDGVTTPPIVSLAVASGGEFVPIDPPGELPELEPTLVSCDGGRVTARQPHAPDGESTFVLAIDQTRSRWEEVPVDEMGGARFDGLAGQRSVAFRAVDDGTQSRLEVLAESKGWEVVAVLETEGGVYEAATLPSGALLMFSGGGSRVVKEYEW